MTQMILSLGGVDLAKRNAIVKDLPVGRDARVHLGDQLRQDRHADDEPDDRRRGGRPDRPLHDLRASATASRARSSTPPAPRPPIEDAILPYLVASDAKLVDGKVVGDPTEGALLVLGYKAGLDIDATRERLPRLATLPFDPTYKLMATFNSAADAVGTAGRALLREGRGAGGDGPGRDRALAAATAVPWDAELSRAARGPHGADGGRGPAGDGRRHARPRPGRLRPGRRPARLRRPTCR